MTSIAAKASLIGETRIVVCVPHYRCRRYIRRAVQSLLEQTYRNLDVVVVNDGDPNPPWEELADIRDPRLFRFSLDKNRGPYFATEVVLKATSAPYLLIQDADDWSTSNRVEQLLSALQRDRADLAVSAEPQFIETLEGNRVVDVRWRNATHHPDGGNFVVHHRLTPAFKYRAPHHGLFRTSSLRAIGGYYGGLRISYDTLVPNLILMTGRIAHIPQGLYFRLIRADSLTHGQTTGIGSSSASMESALQQRLYASCYHSYRLFLLGKLSAPQLAAAIRRICRTYVSHSEQHALEFESSRLASIFKFRSSHTRPRG